MNGRRGDTDQPKERLDARHYLALADRVAAACAKYDEVAEWARTNRISFNKAKLAWPLSRLIPELRALMTRPEEPLAVSTAAVLGQFPPDAQGHIYKLLSGVVQLAPGTRSLTLDALVRILRDRETLLRERFTRYGYPWPPHLDANGRRIAKK